MNARRPAARQYVCLTCMCGVYLGTVVSHWEPERTWSRPASPGPGVGVTGCFSSALDIHGKSRRPGRPSMWFIVRLITCAWLWASAKAQTGNKPSHPILGWARFIGRRLRPVCAAAVACVVHRWRRCRLATLSPCLTRLYGREWRETRRRGRPLGQWLSNYRSLVCVSRRFGRVSTVGELGSHWLVCCVTQSAVAAVSCFLACRGRRISVWFGVGLPRRARGGASVRCREFEYPWKRAPRRFYRCRKWAKDHAHRQTRTDVSSTS